MGIGSRNTPTNIGERYITIDNNNFSDLSFIDIKGNIVNVFNIYDIINLFESDFKGELKFRDINSQIIKIEKKSKEEFIVRVRTTKNGLLILTLYFGYSKLGNIVNSIKSYILKILK